eukprot:9416034-Pyramimonas_sp.AAC.1
MRCRATGRTLAVPASSASIMRWPTGCRKGAAEGAVDNPLSTCYVLGPCDVLRYVASTGRRAALLAIHRHRETAH